ncbi:MAG: (Fe-S)-binding protein [Acidimicrobiia bacterium]|nr:(Fe-S)-binding protein [Acidimicrobiia bacterium]
MTTPTKTTAKEIGFTDSFRVSLEEVDEGRRIRACLQCAACSGICPFGFLMDYPPHKMISAMRAGMFDKVMGVDSLWLCVSCYACAQICPAQIPLTNGLMTRAKEEMLLAGNIPAELQEALENSQRYGNALGEPPRRRADWAADIEPEVPVLGKAKRPVDVLWFVGDYASFHPRGRQASQALAGVLNHLEVDYGILGPEENSDGDSQRLAGETGLFEMLAEKNARAFSKYEFGEILTTDPHAFNALKNEYPALGISYPVRHYSQFLAERLDQLGPLLTGEIPARVAFHDPCYLGRANGIYEEPRRLLAAVPGVELVEMLHNRETSICCGGGGGGMWLDGFQWEKAHFRLSELRVSEAMAAGADILAVTCPYEMPRFEDAAKTVAGAEHLVIKDIAELLAESMGERESKP